MAEIQSLDSTSKANGTVFLDTSLDTHLAVVVSELDTVSDLKRKIEEQYPLCFPNNGKITVHAVKVKRREHLYHLSDSMLIKSAFAGLINTSCWFLSVDVSSLEEHDENEHLHNPDLNNLLTCFGIINNTSGAGVDVSLDDHMKEGTDYQNKDIEVPQKHVDLKDNNTSNQAGNRKRKLDRRLGDESLLKENIGSDEEVYELEATSQYTVGNKEKSENAALDSLATVNAMDDDDISKKSSSRKKKKRKMKSSNQQTVSVAAHSGKDLLEEDSTVTKSVNHKNSSEPTFEYVTEQGITPSQNSGISPKEKHFDSIQQEKYDTMPSAVDVDITRTNADSVRIGEATKEPEISEARKTSGSKDHSAVNVDGHLPCLFKDPNNFPMDIGLSRCENIGTDRPERVEEETMLPQKNDYKGQQLEKCQSLCKDQQELNIQNVKVNSEASKEHTPRKSKERRKRTKTRGLVGEIVGGSDGDSVKGSKHDISSESALHGKNNKSKQEESKLSQTNDEEAFKMNAESASLARKVGDDIHDELGTIPQTSKTQGNAKYKEEQVGKKSKKKHSSKEKKPSGLIAEVQNISHQHSTTSTDNQEAEASSDRTKNTKLEEIDFKSNSDGTKSGFEKFEVETDPVPSQPNSESAKPTNTENHLPTQQQQEVERETKATKGDKPKSRKRHKKADVHATGTSPELQSSLMTNDGQGIGESLSVHKSDRHVLHSEQNLPKASEDGAKVPALDVSDKLNFVSEEARNQSVANFSKTTSHSSKQSNEAVVAISVPERSKNTVHQNRTVNKSRMGLDHSRIAYGKVLGKDSGVVVNSSEQKKRLLGKSGSIFKDDSSGSSEEENGDDRSDTSTRTPSDHSLSSDYSDGESNANMNSPHNGSHSLDRQRGGGRKITSSVSSSDLKHMSFDRILRSSSRFKKAKVTASQPETDTQYLEVVPDSQANL